MPRARPRWPKNPPLMMTLTKKPHSPNKKFFFECRLEDLLRLLMLQPGPQPKQELRYSHANPLAFRGVFSYSRAKPRVFRRKSLKAAGCQSINKHTIINQKSYCCFGKFFIFGNVNWMQYSTNYDLLNLMVRFVLLPFHCSPSYNFQALFLLFLL